MCAGVVAQADPAAVRAGVLSGGYTVELPSGPLVLTEEDVVVAVEPLPSFEAAGSASAVVVLHADLDDDLREEGLSREVISRIQGVRKEMDLGYTDRIMVELGGAAPVVAAVRRFATEIARETLASSVDIVTPASLDDELDGQDFHLAVARVTAG